MPHSQEGDYKENAAKFVIIALEYFRHRKSL
jgi:hypothetical protein